MSSHRNHALLAGPALLAALFAATACGSSSTPSAAPTSPSASSSSAAASAQPDPALSKALLDQASLPPGYTLFSPDANALGQAAAGAITNTSETTFTPAECTPAKSKIDPSVASATMTATTAGASATISEVATRQLHNSDALRTNMAKCGNYTVTTKVMGIETSIRVTRAIVDAPPRGVADDLVVVEEHSESVDPANAAPSTSLTAYANVGKVAIRLTTNALDRPAFDSLVAKAAERARAAS
ncbi:hypothetical protein [Tsukamurella hominis]|uniref:hypothetical protein n=1 Tax=Tsukamurella hominis TaxID=1970232 RepID=UPI0039ED24E3